MAQGTTALDQAVSKILSQHGAGSITRLGDRAVVDVPVVSTGSIALDVALGVGGVPLGRITEIYGENSSGKTTVALHVIANAQKQGLTCAFIDAEHAIDPTWAAILGVDVDNLLIAQPDSGEAALSITEYLLHSKEIGVIVVDSVAALVPKAELEGDVSDQHVGLQARLMGRAMRKFSGIVNKSGTALFFINQTRHKVGTGGYGSPITTSGGRALQFFASVRMDIARIGSVKVGNDIIGNQTRVKVVKNKLAAPYKTAIFELIYNEGISTYGEIVDFAEKFKFIERAGSWYTLDGEHREQGKSNAKEYLKSNPEYAESLRKQIMQRLRDGNNG